MLILIIQGGGSRIADMEKDQIFPRTRFVNNQNCTKFDNLICAHSIKLAPSQQSWKKVVTWPQVKNSEIYNVLKKAGCVTKDD